MLRRVSRAWAWIQSHPAAADAALAAVLLGAAVWSSDVYTNLFSGSGDPQFQAPELDREVVKALTVGEERTFEQDPAFALRLLADIALRALSPAVNDPTTAVQALDEMDGLLRALATRNLGVGHVADRDGTIRVKLVLPGWEDYLAVALDEIIALPTPSPNVSRRILRLLDEFGTITAPSRRPALDARRRQINPSDGQRPADRTT